MNVPFIIFRDVGVTYDQSFARAQRAGRVMKHEDPVAPAGEVTDLSTLIDVAMADIGLLYVEVSDHFRVVTEDSSEAYIDEDGGEVALYADGERVPALAWTWDDVKAYAA